MSAQSGTFQGEQGTLAVGDERGASLSDLDRIKRGLAHEWDIPNDLRKKILNGCEQIIDVGPGDKRFISACKVVLLADSLNVRREATASQEQQAFLNASTDALRAALSNPRLRQALTETLPSAPTETPPTSQT